MYFQKRYVISLANRSLGVYDALQGSFHSVGYSTLSEAQKVRDALNKAYPYSLPIRTYQNVNGNNHV